MWVTMATVGYGDVAARTILGRFAIMGMICFSIVTIPKMTNELIEKMNLQSIYARAYYYPLSLRSSHVVICGSLTSVQLEEFFGELFHPDHDNDNLHAVVLLPGINFLIHAVCLIFSSLLNFFALQTHLPLKC